MSTKACIECTRIILKRYRADNAQNPEFRRKALAQGKKWRDANREVDRIRASDWRKREPVKAKAAVDLWRSKNLDKHAAKEHRRRARKAGAGGSYADTDIAEIIKMQRGKCAYCRDPIKGRNYHVDHILALSRGGGNDRTNIQILCKSCNLSKGSLDAIDFVRARGGLL